MLQSDNLIGLEIATKRDWCNPSQSNGMYQIKFTHFPRDLIGTDCPLLFIVEKGVCIEVWSVAEPELAVSFESRVYLAGGGANNQILYTPYKDEALFYIRIVTITAIRLGLKLTITGEIGSAI